MMFWRGGETHCLVARCPSVDVSSLVLWPSWRWTGPLSSGGITCTTSRSTTGLSKTKCIVHGVHVVDGLLWYPPLPGLRRGTRTSLSTSPPASETPPLVTLSPSENAGTEISKVQIFFSRIYVIIHNWSRFPYCSKLSYSPFRPLSKTVKYNTLKVSKSARSKKAFSKF